jgi:predicted amidohydrolase
MESRAMAEQTDGPAAQHLSAEAARFRVNVVAGIATKSEGQCFNSALLFGPDGSRQGAYDKQKCFAYAGEDKSYAAGTEGALFEIDGIRLLPMICYDLRFAELFLPLAPFADAVIVVANWPESRQAHWETLIRARAIENQLFVGAVNRVGEGGGLHYAGDSALIGPWGDDRPLRRVPTSHGAALMGDIEVAEVNRVREKYPFRVDRRSEPAPASSFVNRWAPVTSH